MFATFQMPFKSVLSIFSVFLSIYIPFRQDQEDYLKMQHFFCFSDLSLATGGSETYT